jgi:hypothetical protein
VLRYIVEVVTKDVAAPDNVPIREDYHGWAFVHLKICLDAFIDSLAR